MVTLAPVAQVSAPLPLNTVPIPYTGSAKMAASTRKAKSLLQVLVEPSAEFYKDEGGKANHLSCTIGLAAPALPCPVPLKIDLYFESEQRVGDADQSILNLLKNKFERYQLTDDEPNVTINFRLEKVSRRKDGQRFKLHVQPDVDSMPAEDAAALKALGKHATGGIFSRAIVVMSKRRTGERFVSRPRSNRHEADGAVPAAVLEMLQGMSGQIANLASSTESLRSLLHSQETRMARMESVLHSMATSPAGRNMGMAGRGWSPLQAQQQGRSHQLAMQHAGMATAHMPLPGVSAPASQTATGLPLTTASNPAGVPAAARPSPAGGSGAAAGIKRIRSSDLQFSFAPDGTTGGGDTTVAPPVPTGGAGGHLAGVPRMTSLDHMFSTFTQGSHGLAMAQDERTAVEALSSAGHLLPPAPASGPPPAGTGPSQPKKRRT